jgi:hypothetical protein
MRGTSSGDGLGRIAHGLGNEPENVLLRDERRLDVQLREFELPVGPQILVAQAAGNLIVPVDSGHHQQLLGQLGALRQHVARTMV